MEIKSILSRSPSLILRLLLSVLVFAGGVAARLSICFSAVLIFVAGLMDRFAILIGFLTTLFRLRIGRPAALWGVTPILITPKLAQCSRLLGWHAQSLIFQNDHIGQTYDIDLSKFERWAVKKGHLTSRIWRRLVFYWCLLRFDIFHYFCDQGVLGSERALSSGIQTKELHLLRRAGKRVYLLSYGADVRLRRTTEALGTPNACRNCDAPGRYCICNDAAGLSASTKRARAGARRFTMRDMEIYDAGARVIDYWPVELRERRALPSLSFTPSAPLIILHAPNHRMFKGTNELVAAVQKLQSRGEPVRLDLLSGVTNEEVIENMARAHIVADQFIIGASGYTALEAMMLGRPVLAWLRDPLWAPPNCPIINTQATSIEAVLLDILEGRLDLAAIGEESRLWAIRHASMPAVADRLALAYADDQETYGREKGRPWRKVIGAAQAKAIEQAAQARRLATPADGRRIWFVGDRDHRPDAYAKLFLRHGLDVQTVEMDPNSSIDPHVVGAGARDAIVWLGRWAGCLSQSKASSEAALDPPEQIRSGLSPGTSLLTTNASDPGTWIPGAWDTRQLADEAMRISIDRSTRVSVVWLATETAIAQLDLSCKRLAALLIKADAGLSIVAAERDFDTIRRALRGLCVDRVTLIEQGRQNLVDRHIVDSIGVVGSFSAYPLSRNELFTLAAGRRLVISARNFRSDPDNIEAPPIVDARNFDALPDVLSALFDDESDRSMIGERARRWVTTALGADQTARTISQTLKLDF